MMNEKIARNKPVSNGSPETTQKSAGSSIHFLPGKAIGWLALGVSIVGLAWLVLPWLGNKVYLPDTWLIPVSAVVLIVTVILQALVFWRWKDRSVLNIVAAIAVIALALFISLSVCAALPGGAWR
jgi:Na+/glutamate symporter